MTNPIHNPTPKACRCSSQPRGARIRPVVVGGLVFGAVVVAAWAVLRMDPWAEDASGLSERFVFDADDYQRADPALIAFHELGTFPAELNAVRGLAVGPEDRIYVAGESLIRVFEADGRRVTEIPVKGEPSCLGLGGNEHEHPGRLYVGADQRILVFDPDGAVIGTWTDGLNDKSVLTSLAVAEDAVFAADAGNRVVLRFDLDGTLLRRIGEIDAARGIRGFVIPSPHFDVAVTADGLVRIANPGARRIETFTADGGFLGQWGKASADIEGFFGCCNPADFTVLPDGRFVTAEKGIPRVKIYGSQGEFECVVADAQMLGQTINAAQLDQDSGHTPTFDVAVDRRGRVLVLDSVKRQVRVFVRK
jgi:sugar lactone lactonase YvrE